MKNNFHQMRVILEESDYQKLISNRAVLRKVKDFFQVQSRGNEKVVIIKIKKGKVFKSKSGPILVELIKPKILYLRSSNADRRKISELIKDIINRCCRMVLISSDCKWYDSCLSVAGYYNHNGYKPANGFWRFSCQECPFLNNPEYKRELLPCETVPLIEALGEL